MQVVIARLVMRGWSAALILSAALVTMTARAQNAPVDVSVRLEHWLVDFDADCSAAGVDFPDEYIDWSIAQGVSVSSGSTGIFHVGPNTGGGDPRDPIPPCSFWAIGASNWEHVVNSSGNAMELGAATVSSGGPVRVTLAMWDEDDGFLGGSDDHLDLTPPGGDNVVFDIDPRSGAWTSAIAGAPLCNTPMPGCADAEGQWCGTCKTSQPCCGTGEGYSFRGDGSGAGLHWTLSVTSCGIPLVDADGSGVADHWEQNGVDGDCNGVPDTDVCGQPWADFDNDGHSDLHQQNGVDTNCDMMPDSDVCGTAWIDSDGDGLLDDWEINGYDWDCDGNVDVDLPAFGADPNHKDLFLEFDFCTGLSIPQSGIRGAKAAFASAPVDAGGVANPDGLPGINLWVDTGGLTDPEGLEGVSTCADGIDNDGEGNVDLADFDCQRGTQEGSGSCLDGLDNDGDGMIDRFDMDCPGIEGTPGNCNDGIDNNGDGTVDAADPECLVGDNLGGGNAIVCPAQGISDLLRDSCDRTNPANVCVATGTTTGICAVSMAACTPDTGYFGFKDNPANFDPARLGIFRYVMRIPLVGMQSPEDGQGPGSCSDGVNNQPGNPGNGADATDPGCAAAVEGTGTCQDGIDNEADGADSADTNCQTAVERGGVGFASCFDGIDNGDGADQLDSECATLREDGSTAANSCWNGIDDSTLVFPFFGDGQVDGADPSCRRVEDGAGPASCTDTIDNIRDGLIDQMDPACGAMGEDMAGAGSCFDLADNAANGGDGADPACITVGEDGAGPGSCYDSLDNSTDGIDGSDPDCRPWGGLGRYDNIGMYVPDSGGSLFFHEIGHSLALGHGGGDGINCKPNYLSVMNYDHGGISQDPMFLVEGDIASAREDGAPAGSCSDGVDNGGGDNIDLRDPDCQSCINTVDDDMDGFVDGNDPDCQGVDLDGDGQGDGKLIDYSPARFPGGRNAAFPALNETNLSEPGGFVDIDTNDDGIQDVAGDPVNLLAFRPFNSATGSETVGGGPATCIDGVDNDLDGLADLLDSGCVGAMVRVPSFGIDTTGDGMPDGFDWNSDGDATDVGLTANVDVEDPSTGSPDVCKNSVLHGAGGGVGEGGVPGTCSDDLDNDMDMLWDSADPECPLAGFDDWRNIRLRGWTWVQGAGMPYQPLEREPTDQELHEQRRIERRADLVIQTTTPTPTVDIAGEIDLAFQVHNAAGEMVHGPIVLQLHGVPHGVTLSTPSDCLPYDGNLVCQRAFLAPGETWNVTFSLDGGACDWMGASLSATIAHGSGYELHAADNSVELEIDSGGAWPQWKMCAGRWGDAPYVGPANDHTAWQAWLGQSIRASATFDGAGNIYIVGKLGTLRSLRPDGSPRWTTFVGGTIEGTPVLTRNGLVVVGTSLGFVRALRQSDGGAEWTYIAGAIIASSPVVGADAIYFGTATGLPFGNSVVALDFSGGEVWRRNVGAPVIGGPSIASNGRILVGTDPLLGTGRIVALNPDGTPAWSTPVGADVHGTPIERNGRVYAGTENSSLVAVDLASGNFLWTYAVPCGFLQNCSVWGTPTVLDDGMIIFGTLDGAVRAIVDNGATRTVAWTQPTSGAIYASPIVTRDGKVLIGSSNRTFYALNVATGGVLWFKVTLGAIYSTASLDGLGGVAFGSDDGNLYYLAP